MIAKKKAERKVERMVIVKQKLKGRKKLLWKAIY